MDLLLIAVIALATLVTYGISRTVTAPSRQRRGVYEYDVRAAAGVCTPSRPCTTGWGAWQEDPPAYGANRADPTVWADREHNRHQEQHELEQLTKAWPANRWQHVRQRENDLEEYERFAREIGERTHEQERERR